MGVAEGQLAPAQRLLVGAAARGDGWQIGEPDLIVRQPLAVGAGRGQVVLDLVITHDPALGGVHQEHAPRLEAALLDDPVRGDVQHPDLRGHHHEIVVGNPVAARAQTVAVQNRSDDRPVGEGDGGRPVPGLHERGVVAVERLQLR